MNRQQSRRPLTALILLTAALGVALTFFACSQGGADPPASDITSSSTVSSSPASTASQAVSASAFVPKSTSSSASEPLSSDATQSSSQSPTADGGTAFLDGTVFIGDSITNGLFLYDLVGNADVLAYTGLNPQTIRTKAFVEQDGQELTVIEAVEGRLYDRAYVMLGANGVAWLNKTTFIKQYEAFLDELCAAMPNTEIYVQSILPVTEAKLSGEDRGNITNEKISEYNEALREMVAEKSVTYLDLWPTFAKDGAMPDSDSERDGIHLRPAAYKRWVGALRGE